VAFVEVQDIRHNPHPFEQFIDAFSKSCLLQKAMRSAVTWMRVVVRVKNVKYLRAIENIKGRPSPAYSIYIYMVLMLLGCVIVIPAPHIELQGLSTPVPDMLN
jgi:hypothetical protein